jgi:hypothetical protein
MPSTPKADQKLARVARLLGQVDVERPAESGAPPDVLAGTFPEQRAFVLDESKRLFVLATRRAAKSFSFGLKCIHDALAHPDRAWNYLFCGLTRDSARRVFVKDVLKALNRQFDLGIVFNETLLTATLPTGSVITVYGADSNLKQHDRLLGVKWRGVGIDESQAWVSLEDLVKSTIAPALVDDAGWLALLGTPGPLVHGFFAKVTRGCTASKLGPPEMREPGYSGHCWTTHQNPYVRENFEADIAALVAQNPRVVETPSFKANWKGEWSVDESLLVYPGFSFERNTYEDLPTFEGGSWHTVVGVDLGWNDPSAFVVCSWHDHHPVLYVRESFAASEMDLTAVAERVKLYEREYDVEATIVDGSAKQAVMEMVKRQGVSLVPASKREKSEFQAILNDDLVQGTLQIQADFCVGGSEGRDERGGKDKLTLIEEMQALVWDQKKFPKHVEHPACSNHQLDALLYAHRYCYPYLSAKPPERPKPGSPEAIQAELDRMWQAELAEIEARRDEQREGLGDAADWDPAVLDAIARGR